MRQLYWQKLKKFMTSLLFEIKFKNILDRNIKKKMSESFIIIKIAKILYKKITKIIYQRLEIKLSCL